MKANLANLLTILSYFCALSYGQSLLKSFVLDDSGDYGANCQIFSSFVTIINCPSTRSYDVILTESLVNTTIADIENGAHVVNGQIIEQTRKLRFSDVDVALVTPSHETSDVLYKHSLIVVTRNQTETAPANQFSVTRYWQNVYTNWIESEHLFDLADGPYDKLFVFDRHAVAVKDQSIIEAVFFDQYRGDVVPVSLMVPIYTDVELKGAKLEHVAFYKLESDSRFTMFGAVRSIGSIIIQSFEVVVDVDSASGSVTQDDSAKNFLLSDTEVTTFETSYDFLIIGCASCDGNQGWIKLYEPEKLKERFTLQGSSSDYQVGQTVSPSVNAGGANEIWFSSRGSASSLLISSILAYYNAAEAEWKFVVQRNLFGMQSTLESDYLEFACFSTWCFVKANLGQTVTTFESCQFNQKMVRGNSLEEHSCHKCEFFRPFSHGYSSTECLSCYVVSLGIDSNAAHSQHMFNLACPVIVEPVTYEEDVELTSASDADA